MWLVVVLIFKMCLWLLIMIWLKILKIIFIVLVVWDE